MKKRRFIENAVILTVFTIIMRGISTLFSIYLSIKIGSEGVGLYQLISSCYLLFVTFSISGMGMTVTRLVSEESAKGNPLGVKRILKLSLIISFFLGIFAGGLLFFTANPIGLFILKDERAVLSLKLLSVSLPFLSVGAVLRGYFLGLFQPLRSISGDIIEQLSGVIFTVMLLSFFSPEGIEPACLCLSLGSVISEIISTLYSYVLYRKNRLSNAGASPLNIGRRIFSIAFPTSVSAYFRSALSTLENILTPIELLSFGLSRKAALSEYGIIKGMVMPLIYFPAAVLSAVSSMLVPEVSAAYATENKKRIDYIIKRCLKCALFFAFFITAIFLVFHREIGRFFYKSDRVSFLLLTFAPLVPLIYLDQIVDSILKGLNEQMASMKYNTADSLLRVLMIYFLVPIIGIKGYVVMFYFGTIFNAYLSLNRLITVGKIKVKPFEWIVFPLAVSLFSVITARLALPFSFIAEILIAGIIYILITALCKKRG